MSRRTSSTTLLAGAAAFLSQAIVISGPGTVTF
jgi:hypothetical protein